MKFRNYLAIFSYESIFKCFKYIPTLLVVLFVLFFYVWSGSRGYLDFKLKSGAYGMYNMLAESFAKGKLELAVLPHSSLIKLEDPYDPGANSPYRMHDASFYKGKYYLYFGPSPVLTLLLPYYLATGGMQMPYSLAVVIFCCGAFIFTTFIFLYLRKKFFPDLPEWMFLFGLLVIGFANLSGWILRRHDVYEVAIACGFMFSTGGLYYLITSFKEKEIAIYRLMLGSLFLGIAIGARIHLVIPVSIVLIFLLFKIILSKSYKNKLGKALLMLLPVSICMVSLLWYNYARFDNPFEHGGNYQLAGWHPKYSKQFQVDTIPINVHYYFFRNLSFEKKVFPHFFIRRFNGLYSLTEISYFPGRTAGLIYVVPLFGLLFIAPLWFWFAQLVSFKKKKLKRHIPIVFFLVSLFVLFLLSRSLDFLNASSICNNLCNILTQIKKMFSLKVIIPLLLALGVYFWILSSKQKLKETNEIKSYLTSYENSVFFLFFTAIIVFLLTINYSELRYYVDFITPLLLSTLFICFAFDKYMSGSKILRSLFRLMVVVFGMASIYITLALSVEGSALPLRWTNAKEFQRLEDSFEVLKFKWVKEFNLNRFKQLQNNEIVVKPFVLEPKRGSLWSFRSTDYEYNGNTWSIRNNKKVYGPVKMKIKFSNGQKGVSEPLLVTGEEGRGNYTYVKYKDRDEIAFVFDHGEGGRESSTYTIDPSRIYELDISTGDLYPEDGVKKELLESVIIKLDGKEVFRDKDTFFPQKDNLQIGVNNIGGKSAGEKFSGQIISPLQQGLLPNDFISNYGPIKMKVKFPANKEWGYEPLLVTGKNNEGNYTIVGYKGNNKIVFAFDNGNGGPVSEEIDIDPRKYYDVEISTGDLYPKEDIRKSLKERAIIKLNGKTVYNLKRRIYESDSGEYGIGVSHLNGVSSAKKFSGHIKDVKRVGLKVSDFVSSIGPYQMKIKFPKSLNEGFEPILTSGEYSMANYLCVGYKNDNNIVFIFNHGSGGEESAPIMINPGKYYDLEVSTGDLYPEVVTKDYYVKSAFVKLNGKEVYRTKTWFYPSNAEEVYIGKNNFAGRHCKRKFTGVIKGAKQEGFEFN